MKILISNDDGIDAEGINILARAMQDLGDIFVVAPDRNRSGASNSLTLSSPLRVKYRETNWISIQGTPTDCVHMALSGLMDGRPDLVVSGINHGANLGNDVWYSGTVAAAMEGRFMGVPSIAFSLAGENHYQTAAHVAKELVVRITRDPLPADTMLNVNVPDVALEELQGYEVTATGERHCADNVIKAKDPRGHPIYWIGPPGAAVQDVVGTDFWAIDNKRVSITPLQVDITRYDAFEQLSGWVSRDLELP